MAPIIPSDGLTYVAIAVIVTFVSHKIVQLYRLRRRLPPGPFPLPFIGNMLSFRKKMFPHEVVNELSKTYGPVITVFLGHTPFVFVTDSDLSLTVLKKHTFAGRPHLFFGDILFPEGTTDIVLGDYGKEWEAMRKVGHTAARKYAISPQLSPSVSSIVERVIESIRGKEVDSNDLFGLIMVSVLAEAAFGRVYDFSDPEFIAWRHASEFATRENNAFVAINVFPFMRFIMRRGWRDICSSMKYQTEYIGRIFNQINESHTEGNSGTFCDAVLTAAAEAESEDHWMGQFLCQENLVNIITDLFSAGTDTTKMTLRWIFLRIAAHPLMQEKMRREVEAAVAESGKEVDLKHKTQCDYTCAFINETLRRNHIVPFGVVHKTTTDVQLDGHMIPVDTVINASIGNVLMDPKVWEEPLAFRPERFLDTNGKFISKPNPYYIPFSDGRRSCPGIKLALNDMFLIVAGFLMRTTSISVVGGVSEELLRGDLTKSNAIQPIDYLLQWTLR